MSQLACPRCGLEPGVICDGYAPAADVETIVEAVPPPMLRALAARLRELAAVRGTAHVELVVDFHQGSTEWEFKPGLKMRRRPLTRTG